MNEGTQKKPDDFWALARSAVYLRGRGVTFGPPLLSTAAINAGVYSIPVGLAKVPGIVGVDHSLSLFADGVLDHVLITPMLAGLPDPTPLIQEATRKLKRGGHLVLFTEVNREQAGLVRLDPAIVREIVSRAGHWGLKEDWEEGGKHLLIVKKLEGRRGIEPRTPLDRRRACVARYGALGDAIVMTPLIRQLAEDGYEVTLNISSYCAPVFENNPHISNLLIQERDLVPNHLLGRYWKFWETQYDKYINLSESLEGDLLVVEGRSQFFTPKAWRHERCNKNYYDYTLARGGYPEVTGKCGELFFTRAEERRAQEFFGPLRDKFTIVWALNGSSHHKLYPMMEATLREWFRSHPDARCVTVGDQNAQALEFPHFQLLPQAGGWSVRESLISTRYAQCVVGPETMITNAAGCYPTPKIVLLSHSTRENLTKYFENDYSLEPDVALAPCYPCHALHYTKESCPVGTLEDTQTGAKLGEAPICALSITPERLMAQLDAVYIKWKESHAKHHTC